MPYEVGKVLKTYRNKAKISVKEISDILTQKGFKASESTIYSWENGNSQPTPGALLTMCSAYKIEDIFAAFGYDGYNDDGSIRLNMSEVDLVEKYRGLDDHGKEIVDIVLEKESARCESDYMELVARGGKYKVKKEDVLKWAKQLDLDDYEEDHDLC